MANYTKATNFTAKDGLPTGNSGKIVKGTEIDTELTAVASAISSKADINSPALTGTPTAPTASAATNTTQLATTAFVQTALASAFTSGMIMMWSGTIATIPTGWVLCNGSNSTPDLRDRFLVGAGSTYAVNATGGSANATLPSHTHTANVIDPGHTHGKFVGDQNIGGAGTGNSIPGNNAVAMPSAFTGVTVAISTEGSSATNANLPPYYALAFIMKT